MTTLLVALALWAPAPFPRTAQAPQRLELSGVYIMEWHTTEWRAEFRKDGTYESRYGAAALKGYWSVNANNELCIRESLNPDRGDFSVYRFYLCPSTLRGRVGGAAVKLWRIGK